MRLLFLALILHGAAVLKAADQPRPATPDEVALFQAALKGNQ